MGFVFLLGAFSMGQMDRWHQTPGLLFTDLSTNNYFFDSNMPEVWGHLETVFTLRDERSIQRGDHIEWVRHDPWQQWYDDGHVPVVYELRAMSSLWNWWSTNIDVSADLADEFRESERALSMERDAIDSQLRQLRSSMAWLGAQEGLYYFLTSGRHTLSNLERSHQNADFFREQPVYLIREQHGLPQSSVDDAGRFYHLRFGGLSDSEFSTHIAFSQEAVDYQMAQLVDAQRQLQRHVIAMIVSFIVALAALIILMVGAGRVWGDDCGEVRFTALDKPWQDLSLVALALYLVATTRINLTLIELPLRHSNFQWAIVLLAVFAVVFTLPLVWWILSFVKRCKAGGFWRRTMVYSVAKWIYDLVKSLWAGAALTIRAFLVGGVVFIASILLIGISHDSIALALLLSLAFTALAVFLMLRYARKLHLVEQGARAASGGDYDARIDVNGGELGSIAASINNISGGINTAVVERMKSERLKTELITNVSHDIRTPITSLITYTDLIKTEGLESENAPEYLDILIQKTARLKTLTDDLFEASKAASGNIKAELETLDLADFVRQVLGEMDERVSASGLDFRLDLPQRAPVRADGKLLWRVMENLLSNVFKYALPGSRVYVDVASEEQWYRVDVKNISEHPLNVEPHELTERFKRGDSARAGEGSGLGLSIAQSFVQSQGGRFALCIDGDLFKVSVHLQKELQP